VLLIGCCLTAAHMREDSYMWVLHMCRAAPRLPPTGLEQQAHAASAAAELQRACVTALLVMLSSQPCSCTAHCAQRAAWCGLTVPASVALACICGLHSCQAVAEVGCLNCGGRVAAHGVAECNVCGVICDTTCRVSWKELLLPCLVQFGMACAG